MNTTKKWNTAAFSNFDGSRPPNPPIIKGEGKGEENLFSDKNVHLIESARKPFASPYLFYKYGGLGSQLGTRIGSGL